MCFVLALITAGLVVVVDSTPAPDQVNPDPLRVGDSGTYAFFEHGEPLGALTFRVDPPVEAAASEGQERSLVIHAASERSSFVLNDHASLSTGKVVRREISQGLDGFEGVKTTLVETEPVIPHLKLTHAPLGDRGPSMVAPTGLTWWERQDEQAVMATLGLVEECIVKSYATDGGSGFVDDRGVVGLSTTVDCGYGLLNRTAWVTDDWPVPALITFKGPHVELVMGLVDFQHGPGTSLVLDGAPPGPSSVEMSPVGSPNPVTGSVEHPYPMEEGLSDVEESTDLLEFHMWRVLHPDSELVGARLMRGEHHWRERDTDRWIFLFSNPQGLAYQVGTERARTSDAWWVTDAGARTVENLDQEPPGQYVSLGGAYTQWHRVASRDYSDSEFNFVQWGMEPEITWSQDCEFKPEPTGLIPKTTGRGQIIAGHSTYGSCTDPKIVKSESYATLDAGSGHALEVAEHEIRLPDYPERGYPRTQTFTFSATTSAVAFKEPGLELVAAIVVPLLVLLWTLYFWPTLQLLLARAVPLLGGYSRILSGDPLRNPVRASMVEAIKADPGVTASHLARRLGIGWGSLAHHGSLLCKEGLILIESHGRYRHFFPSGLPREKRTALALLRSTRTRHALDAVVANPGISQRDLAGILGVTPAGALWHAKRLENAGLLRRQRYGRRVGYHAQTDR